MQVLTGQLPRVTVLMASMGMSALASDFTTRSGRIPPTISRMIIDLYPRLSCPSRDSRVACMGYFGRRRFPVDVNRIADELVNCQVFAPVTIFAVRQSLADDTRGAYLLQHSQHRRPRPTTWQFHLGEARF